VALVLDDRCFHERLSGLSHEVEVETVVEGRSVDRRTGSLLWTHFGISGPVVMDASRFWCLAKERGAKAEVYGNFMPGKTPDQAREWFLGRAAAAPRRSLVKLVAEVVPERCAEAICLHVGADSRQACGQVPRSLRDRLLAALTRFPFPVVRDRGWNVAEVTAGGVPVGRDQLPYDGIEGGAGALSGRGGDRLRRPNRRVQFSMGLGDRPDSGSRGQRRVSLREGARQGRTQRNS
jgi:predicted flavoprotein YhiN